MYSIYTSALFPHAILKLRSGKKTPLEFNCYYKTSNEYVSSHSLSVKHLLSPWTAITLFNCHIHTHWPTLTGYMQCYLVLLCYCMMVNFKFSEGKEDLDENYGNYIRYWNFDVGPYQCGELLIYYSFSNILILVISD